MNKPSFKTQLDAKASHRSQLELAGKIRKNKKEEMIWKRRKMASASTQSDVGVPGISTIVMGQQLTTIEKIRNFTSSFELWDKDGAAPTNQMEVTVRDLRRETVKEDSNQAIVQFLRHGIQHMLVQLLKRSGNDSVVLEAAWIMTNISASSYCSHMEAIVEQTDTVTALENLLEHPKANVKEQVIWCLGNIAGDRPEYRDELLNRKKFPDGILFNLKYPANPSIISKCAWATSNLLRHKPKPNDSLALSFVGPVTRLLTILVTGKVPFEELTELLFCTLKLAEHSDTVLEALSAVPNFLRTMVELIANYYEKTTPLVVASRILANASAGSDEMTRLVVESGILKFAPHLLACRNVSAAVPWVVVCCCSYS